MEYHSKPRHRSINGVHIGVKLLYEQSGHLKGFSHREAHPREQNALGRGMSRNSDRMTWHSE